MKAHAVTITLAAGAALVALLACGDRTALESPIVVHPLCPAGRGDDACGSEVACTPSNTACRDCVNASLCQCANVTEDCSPAQELCGGPSLPRNHACQLAAVTEVHCFAECSEAQCGGEAYFRRHPPSIYPFGMVFSLYDCAVCRACATECAGSSTFATLCRRP